MRLCARVTSADEKKRSSTEALLQTRPIFSAALLLQKKRLQRLAGIKYAKNLQVVN